MNNRNQIQLYKLGNNINKSLDEHSNNCEILKSDIELVVQNGGMRPIILDKSLNERDNFINNEYNNFCKGYSYTPAIMGKVHRIIVFPDIHGDFEMAKKLLIASGVARFNKNNNYEWIGGNAYVVQVGDQIDRCRPVAGLPCTNPNTTYNDEASDIKILTMFTDLHNQAIKYGGAVISLLGNHEIMNAMGEMAYVSYQGLKEFEHYKDPHRPNMKFSSGEEAREHAFAPGNQYGKMLGCTRVPAVIIGSNLFVHAGIVNGLIREIDLRGIDDFEAINIAIRKWLLGILDLKYVINIIDGSKNSMFWTRVLGSIPPDTSLSNPICSQNIGKVLKMFKIGKMVIGHTPQSFAHNDDINGTCDNTVWRVDNGSSAAFSRFDPVYMTTGKPVHSRRLQWLEIIDDVYHKICDETSCK